MLGTEGLAPHFECVLTRPGRMDELTVRVEARGADVDRDAVAADLARRIKDRVGVSVGVEVVDPDGLPRSQGKAQRVRDLR